MNVFMTGASGVLGRAAIEQLVAGGHRVTGLVRSQAKADLVAALGAQPVIGDLFDPAQMSDLVAGADAVLHLATSIPAKARTSLADWAANDRIRTEGTLRLVEACRGRPLRAFIQESIAYVYGDAGGAWLDESAPPRPIAPTHTAVEAERIVLAAHREWGLPAIVLRGATFYHPESWHTRYFLRQVKRRQLPVIGDGRTWWHYIYVDDMARAVVAALEQAGQAAGEIFFVADDQPVQSGELLDYLADCLGAPRPLRIPVWLARLAAGSLGVNVLTMSARYQTGKIQQRLGWRPRYPTYREGFADVLQRMPASEME